MEYGGYFDEFITKIKVIWKDGKLEPELIVKENLIKGLERIWIIANTSVVTKFRTLAPLK